MAFVQPKRKNSKVGLIVGTIFFFFITILLFVIQKDVIFDNSVKFYDSFESGKPKKGSFVELTVDGVIGNYAETKHTTNGVPTGKDQHFIIWLDNDNFISLKTNNKKLIKELNEISDYTWDYVDGLRTDLPKKITIKGSIESMDSEMTGFYNDWIIDEMDCGDRAYYLEIDTTETPGTYRLMVGIFAVLGIGCLIALIFSIKKEKEMNTSGLGGFNNTYTPQTYDPNMFNHTTAGDNIDPNTGNPVLYTGDQGNNGHVDNLSGIDKDSFK